jgi:DnaJ-class molecular chaperone
LVVEVSIEIPSKLSKEAEEHLRAFAKVHGEQIRGGSAGGFFEKFFS